MNAHFRLAKLYHSMGKKDESKAEFALAKTLTTKMNQDLMKKIETANAPRAANAAPAQPPKPSADAKPDQP